MEKKFIASLVLFFVLGSVASAQESQEGCLIEGKFQEAVFSVLGKPRALKDTSYGLTIIDKNTGNVLCEEFVQPEQNVYPASTIKTLIAVAVLRKIDKGLVAFDTRVKIDQINAPVECQDWDCEIYGPGKVLTVERLLFDMITVSNNLATNQLIDVAGRDWINETSDLMQTPTLKVYRKMYNRQDPEPNNPKRNTASASGLTGLYREISTGRLGVLSVANRAVMIEILRNQKLNDRLNGLFPAGLTFYHKTGSTSFSSSDGGYFHIDQDRIAILVGLQSFNKYEECVGDKCETRSGFEAMRQIGKASLGIALGLRR